MRKQELEKLRDPDQLGINPEYREDKYGTYSTGVFKYKGMYVLVTKDNDKWHLEVAQIFPPREEFVNLHTTCYHLFEL